MNLIEADKKITVIINSFRAEWADGLFYYVSQVWIWLPGIVVLSYFGWQAWGWKRMLYIVGGVVLCLVISDQLCNIIKNVVCRLRPSHEPTLEGVIVTVKGYVGGMYGFCSAHACNTSAVAIFTSLIVRRKWFGWMMGAWTILNCWSRIYLGVHYFGDVICGILLGSIIAFGIYFVHKKLTYSDRKVLKK